MKIMRDDSQIEDYKVGYRKPPKRSQFQPGVSGNPSGRPKIASDLHSELLRELKSGLVIHENGKRKVIKKSQGLIKQLTNRGLSGNIPVLRETLAQWWEALERAAQEEQWAQLSEDERVREMSDVELWSYMLAEIKKATSAAKMAEWLAALAQILNLSKPHILELPGSNNTNETQP
jgi:hypothetical protein